MPRIYLIQARKEAELTQQELADLIGSTYKAVSRWETGGQEPSLYYRKKVRKALGNNQDKNLFQNVQESDDTNIEQDSQPSQVDATMDSSDSQTDIPESEEGLIPMDKLRRSIATTIVSGVALPINISLQVLTGPIIDPERSLAQSRLAIADSWQDSNLGDFARVKRTLDAHIPTLLTLASSEWAHQEEAANLGVQGSIMQIFLASRKMNFTGRVFYCKEAIRFAKLSGNGDLLALALDWYGNTYTVCYQQPNKAKSILTTALRGMNSDSSPLVRSAIYSNLSIAHAQDKNENKKAENERLALDYAEQARITIFERPELDLLVSQCGHWDLHLVESLAGKSFLYLAEHFPSSQYAQMAYDSLVAATSKQTLDQNTMSGSLIDKADAARALGDMGHFVDSLGEALPLLSSKRRIVDAIAVVERVPDEWKSEDRVQQLQKDLNNLNNSLVVVR